MPCKGLRQRNGWIIVSVIFVPARQKAIIAAGALLQIDDHSIVAHSSPPSHFAISTRQVLLAMPGAFFDIIRRGVSMLTHPPLSGLSALPGSRGSYFPEEV
jgi:hypothetical protein